MKALEELLKLGKKVDSVMEEYVTRDAAPEFHEVLLYPLRTGGKRIRPALTLACSLALGGSVEDALPAAAAVELAHNYSLIFDDIIDHSELRRGKPTVWRKYGISTAILVAVHYRESIAQALNDTVNPVEFNSIMARTLKMLVDGERLDVLFEQAGRSDEPYVVENRWRRVTLNDYFDMVYRKTAALIETACVFGALSARASAELVETIRSYGKSLGIAFQVGDDMIDIFGREEVTGKKVGKDVEEHKMGNVVVILALEELPASDRRDLESILSMEKVGEADIKRALTLISRTRARSRAQKLRARYVEEALRALKLVPESEGREMLEGLARFILEREF